MTQIYNELSEQIYMNENFKKQYNALFIESAQYQLGKLDNVRFDSIQDYNLKYLLESANIFAQSDNENFQNIALRISQFIIEFVDNSMLKQVASMTLDALVNQQAIKLAIDTNKLPKNIKYYYPLNFSLSSLNRDNEYSFKIADNDEISCNKFQKEFIDSIESQSITKDKKNIISISAPTSAGKSFIVQKWMKYNLELNNEKEVNAAIIVPTRALINQFEKDLKKELLRDRNKININSMPFAKSILRNKSKNIYVFTQERMNIFLTRNKSTHFKAVFVDEAHKIGDNERGVLLQSVVEEILKRDSSTKIVFAGPFVKNPEDIYNNATKIKSSIQTVDRNYFHICRRPYGPKKWRVLIENETKKYKIAKIDLNKSITQSEADFKILAKWAYLIGNKDSGNLIYANGGGQAESIADHIYSLEQNTLVDNCQEINELTELCKTIVHPDFLLVKLLKKRIAFHYGSMPQLIRQKIEELFNKKIIKYLICTSTLLEGVNLSCKNIYVRKPQKGNNIKMSGADLFNLLGRAGRLGKEFCGNIFYIDWNEAPVEKTEQIVERTIHNVLQNNFDEIIASFKDDLPQDNKEVNNIEATTGYLFEEFLKTQNIKYCEEVKSIYNEAQIQALNEVLNEYSKKITLPPEILENYPTIFHYSMQKLFDRFNEKYKFHPESIIPDLSEEGMYNSLIAILSRMKRYFNTGLFEATYPALITTSWMRFKNLPFIIQRRITYNEAHGKKETFNASVRNVFNDIDLYARYKVPKLLACYVEIMNYFLFKIDRSDLIDKNVDIAMFLEYGINNKTYASMIILGLSRSTIFEIANLKNEEGNLLLTEDDFDEITAYKWLFNNFNFIEKNTKLPKLLTNEIKDVIDLYNITL